jgi:ferredoxin-nitrite reductase
LQPTLLSGTNSLERKESPEVHAKAIANAVEGFKASKNGDGLRVLEDLPQIIERGAAALTPAEKELLKWVGMPNGFATSAQLRVIGDLSRRLGNNVLDITTRQQIELRGFTIESVPEIWEKLRGVDLRSLQTGIDNIRNINGCALAGLTPNEAFDASHVVQELDRIFVGRDGNPEYTNLPRKFNITVTGCLDNCTHNESQDVALVPARKGGRFGFNVLVGGKMGSGGFTVASSLNVFVEPFQAVPVVAELVKIYRDHGPREARSKCRFAFLLEDWGVRKLRAELVLRLGHELEFRGKDLRSSEHSDHLGVITQRQPGLVAVGMCIPTGRIDPEQLQEFARLADEYGSGEIRFTIGQNAIIPDVPNDRVDDLLGEPLLRQFSPRPSSFVRGLVACVGTDYCNLALIETKGRAVALSHALKEKLGSHGNPLTIHWSGCPAGCGNHQAADIGFRGFKTMECVPCDENLPGVVAELIQSQRFPAEPVSDWTPSNALPAVASWTRVRQLSAMGSEAGGD